MPAPAVGSAPGAAQTLHTYQDVDGYSPGNVTIYAGTPTTWTIESLNGQTCATFLRIPDLDAAVTLKKGLNEIDLPAMKAGTLSYTCSMGMYGGTITIVDPPTGGAAARVAAEPPSSGLPRPRSFLRASQERAMTTPSQPIEMISFPVEGMTCASCVNRITRFLRKVDGVEEANVNLATESATVRYDRSRVDVSGLVAAVEAAGYVARVDRIDGGARSDAAAGDASAEPSPATPSDTSPTSGGVSSSRRSSRCR